MWKGYLLKMSVNRFFSPNLKRMRIESKKFWAFGFLVVFAGATLSTFSSCSAKKKCSPPCPTWSKKKRH